MTASLLRILLIENSTLDERLKIQSCLQELGYAPVLAICTLEALNLLSQHQPYNVAFISLDSLSVDTHEQTDTETCLPETYKMGTVNHMLHRLRSYLSLESFTVGMSTQPPSPELKMAGLTHYLRLPPSREALATLLDQCLVLTNRPRNLTSAPLDPSPIQQLRDVLGHSASSVISRMVEQFYQDTTERLALMHTALGKRSYPQLANLAHGLKGTSSQMGAMELYKLAVELEHHSKAESPCPITVQGVLASIKAEYSRVSAALHMGDI